MHHPLPDDAIIHEPRSIWQRNLMITSVIIAGLSTLITWLIYNNEAARLREQTGEILTAVSQMKKAQIESWYEDQQADLLLLANNATLSSNALTWIERGDHGSRKKLIALFREYEQGHEVSEVMLCNADGRVFSGLRSRKSSCEPQLEHLLRKAAATGQAVYSDIRRCCSDGPMCVDFVAPLWQEDGDRNVFIVARCSAERSIQKFVKGWPLPSTSSEAYIARRDRDSIVVLSNLRFAANAPLDLVFPMADTLRTVVKWAQGQSGTVNATDYRDVDVIANLSTVPSTGWLLVTKVDRSEVFSSAARESWFLAGAAVLAIFAFVSSAAFIVTRRQVRMYRRLIRRENELLRKHQLLWTRLESSEHRYRTMFEDHKAVKLLIDSANGQILDVNHAAAAFYGWSREQMQMMNIFQINTLPPDELLPLMQEAVATDKSHYEFEHRRADGTVRNVEVFTGRVEIDGRDAIFSVIHDVTEKKKVEEWNRLLARTVEQSHSGVMIATGIQGNIVYINPRFTEMSGMTARDVVGKSTDILFAPDMDPGLVEELERRFLDGLEWEGEFMIESSTGEPNWQHIRVAPVFDDNGELTHAVASISDLTSEKRLIAELKLAAARAEESDRLKSTFLANMSHEVRTPMNAIVGFAELLDDPLSTEEERREYTEVIKQRTYDLLTIINDILDLSLIDANEVKVVEEECSLDSILSDLYKTFSVLLEKEQNGNILLEYDNELSEEYAWVMLDQYRTRQVLTILLSNAMKFTPAGCIKFGCRKSEDETLVFYVSDTGIGISEMAVSFVFERFRQVDDSSSRHYGGNGLGLAIARGIVDLMGGTIGVESELGVGSTFYFTVPLKSVPVAKRNASVTVS